MNAKKYTFNNVAIIGLARDEAPDVATSELLEKFMQKIMLRLNLPKGLLQNLTGIKKRHFYPKNSKPSFYAAKAAENLLSQLNFDSQKIDALYSTSVCRDFIEPSTASKVQQLLKLGSNTKSLDIGNACLGFMDGMELAAIQIESKYIDYALVVAAENSRPIVENTISKLNNDNLDMKSFFKNFATLTLGSGAAAMLLGPAEKYPNSPRLVSSISQSDVAANDLCFGTHEGMETDSPALMAAGVNLALKTFKKGKNFLGWTEDSFDHLICHQVSEANTKKLCQTLMLDENKLFKTYPDYGNIGPVAVPFSLSLAFDKQMLKKHQKIALMGIGSGLNASMMELKW